MNINNKKAFTIIELVFVIVIIGILSAIAIPKFDSTMNLAYDSKAASTLASVRSALGVERQKRILKGDFDTIASLGKGNYAFSVFDTNGSRVLETYIDNCTTGAKGCWTRNDTASPPTYVYTFSDGSGTADFKLVSNRLVCNSDAADCKKLTSR